MTSTIAKKDIMPKFLKKMLNLEENEKFSIILWS